MLDGAEGAQAGVEHSLLLPGSPLAARAAPTRSWSAAAPNGASGRRDARRRGLKVLVIEGAATSGGAAERRGPAPPHPARPRLRRPPAIGGPAAPPAVQPRRGGARADTPRAGSRPPLVGCPTPPA